VAKVYLLPQAVRDLDEVNEPLFSQIISRINLLREYPSLGPSMEGPFKEYRVLTVDIFRVIYRVLDSSTVQIAYIRHIKRQIRH
jgi:plasmid stabilization system protein ParE